MQELKQPLVPGEGASQPLANDAKPQGSGSDETMLNSTQQRKISARTSAGANRQKEFELKQFKKPVLDINGMSQRHRSRPGHSTEMSHYQSV